MIWVINTDTNTCRIYHYQKKPRELTLINELQHPENRLLDQDLVSDKPGRYRSMGQPRSAYDPSSDPKQVKIDNFSREIAKLLDANRKIQAYEQLIIIAGPSMNGLLLQHLNKHVKELIVQNIQKDLLHMQAKELLTVLNGKA